MRETRICEDALKTIPARVRHKGHGKSFRVRLTQRTLPTEKTSITCVPSPTRTGAKQHEPFRMAAHKPKFSSLYRLGFLSPRTGGGRMTICLNVRQAKAQRWNTSGRCQRVPVRVNLYGVPVDPEIASYHQ